MRACRDAHPELMVSPVLWPSTARSLRPCVDRPSSDTRGRRHRPCRRPRVSTLTCVIDDIEWPDDGRKPAGASTGLTGQSWSVLSNRQAPPAAVTCANWLPHGGLGPATE